MTGSARLSLGRKARRWVGKSRRSREPRAPAISLPAAPAGGEAPIFVIGCQRSGTSLVRRIVDSHSRIACPPETTFLVPLVKVLHDRRSERGFEAMGYDHAAVAQGLAGFVSTFYEGYAASQGKPRWADKTPHYVDILDDLWELFGPRARFVTIVRHGMDVAFSLADPKRRYPAIDACVAEAGGDVATGGGLFWKQQTGKIRAFAAAHPEACHELRYEDLTADPAAALEPMFAFLGEPWEPGVIDYADAPHHVGIEDPDVAKRSQIVPNSGRYLAWPAEQQVRVRAACEPLLGELGYR